MAPAKLRTQTIWSWRRGRLACKAVQPRNPGGGGVKAAGEQELVKRYSPERGGGIFNES